MTSHSAYLKALYNVGTVHYERACEMYYASPCRAPALFLLSSTDPVGNERRIRRAVDLWMQMGIEVGDHPPPPWINQPRGYWIRTAGFWGENGESELYYVLTLSILDSPRARSKDMHQGSYEILVRIKF